MPLTYTEKRLIRDHATVRDLVDIADERARDRVSDWIGLAIVIFLAGGIVFLIGLGIGSHSCLPK